MALNLKYATKAQLGAAFRERYRNTKREECARLAKWLLARISDGDFTDAQVRAFFSLSQANYDAMKAHMVALVAHYDAVQAGVGE